MTDLNVGSKFCDNCKQQINLVNFLVHEAFCRRNIVLCKSCKQPYDKNKSTEHFEDYHATSECICGESIEKMHFDSHKLDTCKKRQVECVYCELSLTYDKYKDHFVYCSSRTEQCTSCKKYIQLKDRAVHESKCYNSFDYQNIQNQNFEKLPKQQIEPELVNNEKIGEVIGSFILPGSSSTIIDATSNQASSLETTATLNSNNALIMRSRLGEKDKETGMLNNIYGKYRYNEAPKLFSVMSRIPRPTKPSKSTNSDKIPK